MTATRPHHVLVEVDRARFHSRLRAIEAWLADWEIDAEIGSVLGSTSTLRIWFADDRAAYAFQRCYGGSLVSTDGIEAARAAEAADENLYDRLVREFPD